MFRFFSKLFYKYNKDYEEELHIIKKLPSNHIPLFIKKGFLYNKFRKEIYETEQWNIEPLVNSGYYAIKGKEILKMYPLVHGSGITFFKVPFDCKLIKVVKYNQLGFNELVLIVEEPISKEDFRQKLFEQNKKTIFLTEFIAEFDEFRDSTSFYLKNVCGKDFGGLRLYNLNEGFEDEYLEFGLKGSLTHVFLMINTNSINFTLANNDVLIFLFEDNTTLQFKFDGRHIGKKGDYFNLIHLTKENQEDFFTKKIKKVKIESHLKGIYSVFSFGNFINNKQYDTFEIGQFAFKYIFQFYLSSFKNHRKHL